MKNKSEEYVEGMEGAGVVTKTKPQKNAESKKNKSLKKHPIKNKTKSDVKTKLKSDKPKTGKNAPTESDGILIDSGNFSVVPGMRAQKQHLVRRSLPTWLRNPHFIATSLSHNKTPLSKYEHLLSEGVLRALVDNNYTELFPVQCEILAELLTNSSAVSVGSMPGGVRASDVCCSAPTGSGKTLAFVLPVLQILSSCSFRAVRCLVVVPVVELATQVFKVFQMLAKYTPLKIGLANGVRQFSVEQHKLVGKTRHAYKSKVDVLVCTPGRLVDHLQSTPGFNLTNLRFIVIDEADRMMEEVKHDWLDLVERAVLQPTNSIARRNDDDDDDDEEDDIDNDDGGGGGFLGIDSSVNTGTKKLYDLVTSSPSLSSSLIYDHFNILDHCNHQSVATTTTTTTITTTTTTTTTTHRPPQLQKLLFSATLSHNPEKLQLLKLYHPKLFTSAVPAAAAVVVVGGGGKKDGGKGGDGGVKEGGDEGMKKGGDGVVKEGGMKESEKDDSKKGLKRKYIENSEDEEDDDNDDEGDDDNEDGDDNDEQTSKKPCLGGDLLEEKTSRNEFLGKYVTPSDLTESFIEADASQKPLMLLHLLARYKAVLCFTNSVEAAKRLCALMGLMGVEAREFSSSLHIGRRARTIQAFNNHKIQLIVASDAMSRGLDLERVDCVVSYNVPSSFKTYIHRVGRTARAGATGTAVALLEKKEIFHFKKITRESGKGKVRETKVQGCLLERFKPALQQALKKLPESIHQRKRKVAKSKS